MKTECKGGGDYFYIDRYFGFRCRLLQIPEGGGERGGVKFIFDF